MKHIVQIQCEFIKNAKRQKGHAEEMLQQARKRRDQGAIRYWEHIIGTEKQLHPESNKGLSKDIHEIIDTFTNAPDYEHIPTSIYLSKNKQDAIKIVKDEVKRLQEESQHIKDITNDEANKIVDFLVHDYETMYHKSPKWK